MILEEEVKREYFRAILLDNCNLTNTHVKEFKNKFPDVFKYLHSFYRLRSEMNRDIEIMQRINVVQWFTLTFDNKRDKNLITSKRKSATRFLNEMFICYLMVEEFGSDNNRYHIHGFGVFRDDKNFNDFIKWSSRCKIEYLSNERAKKKVKYLTKYSVKDLPRIRRSKGLVYLVNFFKSSKIKNSFPKCFECQFRLKVERLRFNVYNQGSKELRTTRT